MARSMRPTSRRCRSRSWRSCSRARRRCTASPDRWPSAPSRSASTSSSTTTGAPRTCGRARPDAQDLFKRLTALPGYGKEKAKIFMALLAKRFGIQPAGWEEVAAPFSDARAPLDRRRRLTRDPPRGAGLEEGEEGGGQGQGRVTPDAPDAGPSIGERIERSASAQIVIGILIVAALLAQVVTHLPEQLGRGGRARSERALRGADRGASSRSGGSSPPTLGPRASSSRAG